MTALEVSSNPDHSCEGCTLLKPERIVEEISAPFPLHHAVKAVQSPSTLAWFRGKIHCLPFFPPSLGF